MLDIDSALWFLALDVPSSTTMATGFAQRLHHLLDDKGKFHIVPHDMNEAFHGAMGGPGMGGPGGGFMMRMPRPGEILPPPLVDQLRLTDEQKKKFEQLQKETDEKLEKLLTPNSARN